MEDNGEAGDGNPGPGVMSKEDTRLFLIRQTLLEMLRDRGFLVEDGEINATKEQFVMQFGRDILRPTLDFFKERRDNPADKVYVFFPASEKVGISVIKEYAEFMKQHDARTAILVVQNPPTPFANQCIKELSSLYTIEMFEECDLLVNISKNMLLPPHTVLTDEEKKAVEDRYNIDAKQIPRLPRNDPVARYYGMKKGQFIKFLRPGLPGEAAAYQYRRVE